MRGAGASHRERVLERQRVEESRMQEIQKFVSTSNALASANFREDSFDVRRKTAELNQLAFEQAQEQRTRSSMLEARRKQREFEQEEALAKELERQLREEESKRREIQRICDTDPSLRALQAKLQSAYITKELSMQISLQEKQKEEAKIIEKLDAIAMEEAAKKADQEREERMAAQRALMEHQKRVLEQQLEEKQIKVFLEAEEEAAKEREMVSAILAKIAAEDAAEAEAKRKAHDDLVNTIEEFKQQRERAVAAAKAAEKAEEAKIAAFAAAQLHREEEIKRAKDEDAAIRDAKYRALVKEQEAIKKAQEEEEALRWLLVSEEAANRRAADDRAAAAKQEALRREMMRANEQQKAMRERLVAEERAREEKLIRQFLEKCAEDDKKAQLARLARQEARARYMAEVELQVATKKAFHEAEKLAALRAKAEEERKEEFRKSVIEEARRALLAEHASKLRGFLPRGVITSNADLDLLKAFDRDGDGVLTADEMEMAQAAFRINDGPVKAAPSERPQQYTTRHVNEPVAKYDSLNNRNNSTVRPVELDNARSKAYVNKSSISFGDGQWDESVSRARM